MIVFQVILTLLKIALAILIFIVLNRNSPANRIKRNDLKPNSIKSDDWYKVHGKK